MVLLDACAVVNLYATRRIAEILAATGQSFGVVEIVVREAQYVFRGGVGDNASEREPVQLNELVEMGLVEVLEPYTEAELLDFVDFSRQLDDGEAMTTAVALHRGASVATDDRKAIRVLTALGVDWISTLEMLKSWSDQRGIDHSTLRDALVDLRLRANYEPARTHPLRAWWEWALSKQ
jgi:predicted nucleic acid-binding protein